MKGYSIMSKINVAVIGCGTIAKSAHIPSYLANPDVNIKYFCDIIPERADEQVKAHGGTAVYDYKEILNDPELDAVSVCTPNDMHPIISCDFLRAGKNVLCEKPAARTIDEVHLMQKTAEETGKILNIGVVNRFNNAVNKIKEIIKEGTLGDVYHIYISFRQPRCIPGLGGMFTTKSVAGGGVLIDWGVHYLDLVMYCMNDPEPKSVSAQTYSKLATNMRDYVFESMWAGPPDYNGTYDVEEFVTGFIRTEGPTMTFNGAWAQNIFVPETYIDFIGTKGGIRLKYGADFELFTVTNGKLTTEKPEFDNTVNMFNQEINHFIDCIRSGEHIRSHIDKAEITARIMQGIYDSAELGREVSFE